MHVAIVNNGIHIPENILKLIEGNTSEIFNSAKANQIKPENFDLIILSGSSQFAIEPNKDKLSEEISLIQSSITPIIGLCYGCQLIAVAFGGSLKDMGAESKERKPIEIKVTQQHPIFLGKKSFLAYDAHRWVIDRMPECLESLAVSDHGIELIHHKNKPIYGFQFHPEKMTDTTFGKEVFNQLLVQLGLK